MSFAAAVRFTALDCRSRRFAQESAAAKLALPLHDSRHSCGVRGVDGPRLAVLLRMSTEEQARTLPAGTRGVAAWAIVLGCHRSIGALA